MPTQTYTLVPDQNVSDVSQVEVEVTVQPDQPPLPPPLVSTVKVADIDAEISGLDAQIAGIQSQIDALNAKRSEVLAVAQTATLTPAQ